MQVLIKNKASSICGGDIRAIYRQHTGKGPEGYQPGMIAGHEPCSQHRLLGRPAGAAVGACLAVAAFGCCYV